MAVAFLHQLKRFAGQIKSDIYTLYYAARDKRTPWYAKYFVAVIVAYAISPIDLIPDFIPIIGYVDDLILLPIMILFAIKLIPETVLTESRIKAEKITSKTGPTSIIAAGIIIFIWLMLVVLGYHYFQSSWAF